MRFSRWLRLGCLVLAAGLSGFGAKAATWFPLGPFGGDARSLAADPVDSRHLFLGTATGWVYDSKDGGEHWNRVAQIGKRNDLVIDHLVVDRTNPKRLIVGAYTVDHLGDGGVFVSEDYGKSWYSQAEMRGQSVRALTRSVSDPTLLVAGTLRGVYRSNDNGVHWKQISPAGSAEIKEVQSIAVDPANPDVIYAGTWHLPWKTTDGGATWVNIKDGIIDDSDVFSIIVDPKDPKVVYASACSGIYKSANAGELFHKVQGIPSAARRTRTLEQDPANLDVVFAGTTEGLYRTDDAGTHWSLLTPADVIVNDVYVDPANNQHVLMATDRGGVYRSEDGGTSFESSNSGFSTRQVIAFTSDAQRPGTVYVGVVNDKTTGGVFHSADGGVQWEQQSEGLGGRDVFSLVSLSNGTLLAGTSHGVFRLQEGAWADSSALGEGQGAPAVAIAPEHTSTPSAPTRIAVATPVQGKVKPVKLQHAALTSVIKAKRPATHSRQQRSPASKRPLRKATQVNKGVHLVRVKGRVSTHQAASKEPQRAPPVKRAAPEPSEGASAHLALKQNRLDSEIYSFAYSGDVLLAGTSSGLLRSGDAGEHWTIVNGLVMPDVHYVASSASSPGRPPMVMVSSLQRLALSSDGGATWDTVALPADLTQIGAIAIDGDKNLWVGGREGVWLSTDYGATWKTLHNLFLTEVDSIFFDAVQARVLVTASNSPVAFSVSLPEHKVTYWDTGWNLRFVRPVGDHLIGATFFDGVVVQPKMVDSSESTSTAAGK